MLGVWEEVADQDELEHYARLARLARESIKNYTGTRAIVPVSPVQDRPQLLAFRRQRAVHLMNQPELFPITATPTPEPLTEGFKAIYCGIVPGKDGTWFRSYLAVFADHDGYAYQNPNWLQHVTRTIAQQTTRPITYNLYIYDKKTGLTHLQGRIQ